MEFTGDLKKQLENAQTKEEAKEVIKKEGVLMDDDELENVAGGYIYKNRRKNLLQIVDDNDGTVMWEEKYGDPAKPYEFIKKNGEKRGK